MVFETILPSVRKNGFYSAEPLSVSQADETQRDLQHKIEKLCYSLDRIEQKEVRGYSYCRVQARSIREGFLRVQPQLNLLARACHAHKETIVELRKSVAELSGLEPTRRIVTSTEFLVREGRL